MKKLLIATDSFLPRWDGIARFLSELLPDLSSEYEITVVAPEFKGPPKNFPKIKVVRIPLSKIKTGDYHFAKLAAREIKALVKETDIVWTHTIGSIGFPAIWYAKRFNKPVIAYIHSLEWELASKSVTSKKFFQQILQFLIKHIISQAYNRCDMLLVPSSDVAKNLRRLKITTKKRIVRMGVNIGKFRPPHDKALAKQAINIEPDNVVIGYTGRLGREKNVETLYRAFMRLDKFKNVKLLIIGRGVKEIEKLFANNDRIKLVKYTSRIVRYLQAMDIYVLPSLTETSSLSTMEAMSTGLAVVTTRVGLIRRYIRDRRNGFFFPKENDYVLSVKLEWLINNKILREELGKNARETIIKRYQWATTVGKIKRALALY
jgi:glycosyltransferase involved in cell wall biosynthesis